MQGAYSSTHCNPRSYFVRPLLFPRLLWLFLCLLATWGVVQYDQERLRQRARAQWQRELDTQSAQLQAHLDSVAQHNQALALSLEQERRTQADFLTALVQRTHAAQPLLRHTLITRQYKGIFVYPLEGNEAVVGINYDLRPEFMSSIARTIRTRAPVLEAPVRLMQTGENALIVRSAIFAREPGSTFPDVFWGHVASVVELPVLLRTSGLLAHSNDWALSIQAHYAQDDPTRPAPVSRLVWGQELDPNADILARASVVLDRSTWEIRTVALHPEIYPRYPLQRQGLICLLGALLGGGPWVWAWRWRHKHDPPPTSAAPSSLFSSLPSESRFPTPPHGSGYCGARWGLRTVLLWALLLPVPALVGVTAWLSFQASIDAAHELEQRQASEVARRIYERTVAFFDIPRQMVIYNAEQFRTGQLNIEQPEAVQRNFLLQLRHQPLLTFLSLGTYDNAYYSASHPPLGQDKALRALRAGPRTGHKMQMYRVDDDYRPSTTVMLGTGQFYPHQRLWYQTAKSTNALCWYPTYRYAINDAEKQYEALGLGMSTPLYDTQQRFVGVLAADVALSQLSTFLRTQMQTLGGLAFLTENSGELLASSDDQPIYHLQDGSALVGQVGQGGKVQRIRAVESAHALTRSSQEAVAAQKTAQGRRRIRWQGLDYLLNWHTVALPNGPTFTLVVALPQSHFDGPARQTLHQVVILALGFGVIGVLLVLWLAQHLASPLLSLHRWAGQLAQGQWQSPPPLPSTVREVADLSHTLGDMAQRLQRHTEELEQRVAARTADLEQVNRQLEELATTDALTGIANRRHFDRMLAAECARAQRSGLPLALLMLDVDYFKPYNDHYGHLAGDAVLQAVAAALQSRVCRAGDLLARYGGEEFVVIAVNTNAAAACELGEALRAAVADLRWPHAHAPLGHVTVSVGVTVCGRMVAGFAQQGLRQADLALYQAKGQGRNQVALWHSDDGSLMPNI